MADKVGVQVSISFHGEQVHCFESFPSEPLNTLFQSDSSSQHGFSGKLDGGEAMAPLKNAGPMAQLVRALIDAKESSEQFLSDKVARA